MADRAYGTESGAAVARVLIKWQHPATSDKTLDLGFEIDDDAAETFLSKLLTDVQTTQPVRRTGRDISLIVLSNPELFHPHAAISGFGIDFESAGQR